MVRYNKQSSSEQAKRPVCLCSPLLWQTSYNSASLLSLDMFSFLLIIFVASGLTPTGPQLSYVDDSRAGCRVPGQVLLGWSRGAESPPFAGHTALDTAQDMADFQGCKCSLPAHEQLFIHQYLQFFLFWAAL